jgi:hypothetical protein
MCRHKKKTVGIILQRYMGHPLLQIMNSWVVKGYISQAKDYNVNCVRVAASTTKEKAHRLVVEKMKGMKSSNMSNLSGGFEVPCKIEGGDVCKNSIVAT